MSGETMICLVYCVGTIDFSYDGKCMIDSPQYMKIDSRWINYQTVQLKTVKIFKEDLGYKN